MPLTDAEIGRCRYHMGYVGLSSAASLQFGVPQPSQTAFLFESAVRRLLEVHVGDVRDLIARCDATELQIFEAQERLAAEKLGEITLRKDEIDALQMSYVIWVDRMADLLGCPKYPYSNKLRGGGGGYGNIPVTG